MKHPCKTCKYIISEEIGHRIFTSCSDEEKKKGFKEDNYWYNHECSNHEPREECKTCQYYCKPYGVYCGSVMAFVNGKCVDHKPIEL